MTKSELFELLVDIGIPACNIYISDQSWNLPTIKWVTGKYSSYYRSKLFGWGLWKWKPDYDCDNFARHFAAFAQTSHAKTNKIEKAEGLTIGEFWYRDENVGGHAINIVISDKVYFIEPQRSKCNIVKLTEKEIQSCMFCRF